VKPSRFLTLTAALIVIVVFVRVIVYFAAHADRADA